MNLKVVATDGLDTAAAEHMAKTPGLHVDVRKGVAPTELLEVLKDADFVIIRSATVLKREQLAQLPKLKGVLRAGVGIDNIDVKAASDLGIWVWNAPTGNFQATAELALGLIFAAARQIAPATAGAKEGKWLKKEISDKGRQLSGATLGIYGAGNIGLRVARMARAIGMDVIICDPVFQSSTESPFKTVTFEKLLEQSDFVTIHAPILDSTRHAFSHAAFQKMKKSAIIVNAARGGIIKDADLLKALDEKWIAGAALDVFEVEPFDANDPVYSKLLRHPGLLAATPHMGASTIESQKLVSWESAEKISAVALAAGSTKTAPRPLNQPMQPRLRFSGDFA